MERTYGASAARSTHRWTVAVQSPRPGPGPGGGLGGGPGGGPGGAPGWRAGFRNTQNKIIIVIILLSNLLEKLQFGRGKLDKLALHKH